MHRPGFLRQSRSSKRSAVRTLPEKPDRYSCGAVIGYGTKQVIRVWRLPLYLLRSRRRTFFPMLCPGPSVARTLASASSWWKAASYLTAAFRSCQQ
ncbi:hypothetical protein FYA67_01180 [Bordetella holmesii]|nr:hypothetical protein FYB59_01180 [Bordetella holmesii]QGB13739.1 hypothetical protein FYB57_01180 [Bordetella holmesii]QGB62982.1 hypothetical protein FYB43_01180 [Bordetella holmesii]QGC41529.1 hypothetical protein FYB19_01180 [Bordetella holmesii]QGC61435.1 hypothetical protein FYB13_01180 [Bordetella holmesii]